MLLWTTTRVCLRAWLERRDRSGPTWVSLEAWLTRVLDPLGFLWRHAHSRSGPHLGFSGGMAHSRSGPTWVSWRLAHSRSGPPLGLNVLPSFSCEGLVGHSWFACPAGELTSALLLARVRGRMSSHAPWLRKLAAAHGHANQLCPPLPLRNYVGSRGRQICAILSVWKALLGACR